MADLAFKCLLDGRQPIAGLFWESSCPVLHVFDRTGRELVIDVPCDSVRACAHGTALEGVEQFELSPCGRYVAILRSGKIAVWNSQKDRVVASPPSADGIERIAWRANPPGSEGQLWLAGSFGLAVWSAEGHFTIPFRHCTSETTAMAWDPRGTYLAQASRRGELQLWNARTNQWATLERTHEHPFREFAWSSRSAILAGLSVNNLLIWNVTAVLHGNTPVPFVRSLHSPPSRLVFRPSGNVIAVGAINGALELCRVCKLDEAIHSAVLPSAVTHLAWSRNGKQLAAGTCSGQVYAARICK